MARIRGNTYFPFVIAILILCGIGINAQYRVQEAAPAVPGGPGLSVKQWNATGSNNQTTQFTFAIISNIPYYIFFDS